MTGYQSAVALWRGRRIANDAELAQALNGHSILFAYNSGKIENDKVTYHDTREVFEHDGVTGYTGDLRTLFELRNAKEAYELFLSAFGRRRPLDEALLLSMQLQLTHGTYDTRRYQLGERPGTYKRHDYVTGREEVAELLAELQDISDENALTAAAYFHARLENIHPFADGNGRTGRLAMNYLLALHNHPIIVIHEEERREYYEALEAWDRGQDLKPLVRFLEWQTEKTWEKQLQKEQRRKRQEPERS